MQLKVIWLNFHGVTCRVKRELNYTEQVLNIFLLKQQCCWISQTERQRFFFKCDIFIFMTLAFSEVDYNRSISGTNVLQKLACEMTWDKYFHCLQNWGRNCYRECTRYNNSTTDNTDVIFPSAGQVYPHILVIIRVTIRNCNYCCWFHYACECQSHSICAALQSLYFFQLCP